MFRPSARVGVVAALAVLVLVVAPAAAAKRQVPRGFWGANWGGPISGVASAETQAYEWDRMAVSGVESQRATFLWSAAQRYEGDPTNFAQSDELVIRAASHRIRFLPVVAAAPHWARQGEEINAPPSNNRAYADYLKLLIGRYGPNGTFWLLHPELPKQPIRRWQIWNEPSANYQWTVKPGKDWARPYGKLLRKAYAAAKEADPGARVILAGLPNTSAKDLEHLYEAGGIHGYFDAAAVHPYTAADGGVLTLVKRFKRVMRKHGDGKLSLLVTELGLPASKGKSDDPSPLQTTDAGMAKHLVRSFKDLTANRRKLRIPAVYWYDWASSYDGWIFNYTGLLDYTRSGDRDLISPKPALKRFRNHALQAEGCAKDKSGRCVQK
jgi:hypothetical protein